MSLSPSLSRQAPADTVLSVEIIVAALAAKQKADAKPKPAPAYSVAAERSNLLSVFFVAGGFLLFSGARLLLNEEAREQCESDTDQIPAGACDKSIDLLCTHTITKSADTVNSSTMNSQKGRQKPFRVADVVLERCFSV